MNHRRPVRPGRARRLALAGALALLAAASPAVATTGPAAEISSSNLFLGTTKVEAGARANGSFGSTVAAPAGYNPLTESSSILGFRVNPAECAWTDGACVTLGDFFTPGTPYEVWGVQVGGGTPGFNSQAVSGIAGAFASADAAGVRGVWQSSGAINGISVKQTYAIPSYAWMIDTTVELTNTTGAPIDDVYFLRGLDPDNCRMEARALCDSDGDGVANIAGTSGGGVYKTHNAIVSQGSASTPALVTATQTNDSYLALRATGAEARAFVKNSSFANPASIATLWSGADGAFRSTIASSFGDTGIYAVVRVPSIAAGATATVHVQYVVKEIPAAADFAETVASSGGLIDVSARNGGAAFGGICTAPAHGTAVAEGGRVRYTPAAGYSGPDSFTYSTGGPCGTVTVTVPAASVRQVNYCRDDQGVVWCASQAETLAEYLDLEYDEEVLSYGICLNTGQARDEFWLVNDRTPYRDVRNLLPNHYLDLRQGRAVRYWPREGCIPSLSVDESNKLCTPI